MDKLQELLPGIRSGDEFAAAEFVRVYALFVRMAVRARMRIARLRRTVDSSDFCQSVLGSFLVRAALGQYELTCEGDLKALLGRMTANKIADAVRRPEFAPGNAAVSLDSKGLDVAATDPTPSVVVMSRELIQVSLEKLTDRERQIRDLRCVEELSWIEIGARLGESPDALRKRLDRARERIVREVGLVDSCDG